MPNRRYCGQKADFLRRQHSQCRDFHATGIREMTQLAAQATGFKETVLRNTLRAIAPRGRTTTDAVSAEISTDWTSSPDTP